FISAIIRTSRGLVANAVLPHVGRPLPQQLLEFCWPKLSPLALRQVAKQESAKPHALEERHLLVDRGEHHSYLSLTSFVDGDAVRVRSLAQQYAYPGRPGHLSLNLHTLFKPRDIRVGEAACG